MKHPCETPEASLEGAMALPIADYTQVKDNNSVGSALSSEPGQIHFVQLQGRLLLLSPGNFRQRQSEAKCGTEDQYNHLAHWTTEKRWGSP